MSHFFVSDRMDAEDCTFDANRDFLLFLHAQRTGGSALRHVIANAWSRDELYCTQFVENFEHWNVVPEETLKRFKGFAGHSNFSEREFSRRLRMVTILRHPVFRTVSLYYYVRGRENHALHEAARSLTLADFYRSVRPEKKTYFDNVMCRRICGKPNYKMARERIENDFWMVGMSEYLGEFVDALLERLGKPAQETPDLGSDMDKYQEEIADSSLVAEIFENNVADAKLFAYMNEAYFKSRYKYPSL
jgi:hypothetical protein